MAGCPQPATDPHLGAPSAPSNSTGREITCLRGKTRRSLTHYPLWQNRLDLRKINLTYCQLKIHLDGDKDSAAPLFPRLNFTPGSFPPHNFLLTPCCWAAFPPLSSTHFPEVPQPGWGAAGTRQNQPCLPLLTETPHSPHLGTNTQ